MLSIPDTKLARLGIYYDYHTGENLSPFKSMGTEEGMEIVRDEIENDKQIIRQIRKHGKRSEISYEEALDMVIDRVYEHKSSP